MYFIEDIATGQVVDDGVVAASIVSRISALGSVHSLPVALVHEK
jgi:hypothetical protein